MIAKVCVAVLNGRLTDVVSLNYSLSSTPQTATGNLNIKIFMRDL